MHRVPVLLDTISIIHYFKINIKTVTDGEKKTVDQYLLTKMYMIISKHFIIFGKQ